MNDENLLILFVSIYGNMQTQMEKVDMCDKNGIPKKPENLNEQDTVKLYEFIAEKLRGLSKEQIQAIATKFNDMVKTLLNEEQMVNNYLMAMMLYRNYFDDISGVFERSMHGGKVARQIEVFEKVYAKDEEQYRGIKKTTGRVVDNLWRILTDRPQLTDEIRDLKSKRYLRKK